MRGPRRGQCGVEVDLQGPPHPLGVLGPLAARGVRPGRPHVRGDRAQRGQHVQGPRRQRLQQVPGPGGGVAAGAH
ncbi:MAG: hypothetical protein NTW05_13065, partial [Pseudonocardiales bacterium]|nr:hypothetical protein [Pseudonocardiales bacterium]